MHLTSSEMEFHQLFNYVQGFLAMSFPMAFIWIFCHFRRRQRCHHRRHLWYRLILLLCTLVFVISAVISLVQNVMEHRRWDCHLIQWCQTQKYRDTSGPKVALASFPGSGNTWLRYLIQQSTGLITGYIYYQDLTLHDCFPDYEYIIFSSFFAGDDDDARARFMSAVKTHEYVPSHARRLERVILLVRDPRKAILAEFNRKRAGHLGHAEEELFWKDGGRIWQDFVRHNIRYWEDLNFAWLEEFRPEHQDHRLVILYEELVNETERVLREIATFLGVAPLDEEALRCTVERREGVYRRRKRKDNKNVTLFDERLLRNMTELAMEKVYGRIALWRERVGKHETGFFIK